MECRHVRSRLTGYLDGDLQPAERRHVERHVAGCPACGEELEHLRLFTDACADALTYTGPVYSFESLRARMATVEPLREVIAFLPKLRVQGAIPRFAVAMLLMMLVGVSPASYFSTRQLYGAIKTPFSSYERKLARNDSSDLDALLKSDIKERDAALSGRPHTDV